MTIMKRIIALSILLLSTICWGQKVNKNIAGFTVGGYSNPQLACRHIETQYDQYASVNKFSSYHLVKTHNIPFAGKTWDNLTIKITNRNKVAEISFSDTYGSVLLARDTFEGFQAKLGEKYGAPKISQPNYFSWGDKTCVTLEQTSKLLRNDSLVYMITITYYDEAYLKQLESDILKEL